MKIIYLIISICSLFGLAAFILFFQHRKESYISADKKLNIIIPVRDREEHLNMLLPALKRIMKAQSIDYRIYVIEQSEKYNFNKGKVNNAGFLIAQENRPTDTYVFNDVDNIPVKNDSIRYNFSKPFVHYYGFWSSADNFFERHTIGGIFSIKSDLFKKVNGFPNNYWGWGAEDTDFGHRLHIHNVDVDQSQLIDATHNRESKDFSKIKDIDHVRNAINQKDTDGEKIVRSRDDNHKIFQSYYDNNNLIQHDGLNNCNFKILKFTELDKHIYQILIEL